MSHFPNLLDFDLAQKQLAAAGQPPRDKQPCPLSAARGRVLAQTIAATFDTPPADNSAMDGYAIRWADAGGAAALPIQQVCYAGQRPAPLKPGTATRLFTGSLIPEGADTVIMQENCQEDAGAVRILELPELGRDIRRQGEDIRAGTDLVVAGTVLGPAQIGILASQGLDSVQVRPRVRVGILTTGDELVAAGQTRGDEQIFDANGPMLAGLAHALDAEVVRTGHAPDDPDRLREALSGLLEDCQLILTVGGVSVGEKDLVKATIAELGGSLDLWRVRMKPGKPVALARIADRIIVGLPGNPVSAFAVHTLLVSPLIRSLQGRADIFPPVLQGILQTDRVFRETRDEFLRVRATPATDGRIMLEPYARQGSGIISSLPWATGLARIPADTEVRGGDIVDYYDFRHWLV